jgi:hypothetical protein
MITSNSMQLSASPKAQPHSIETPELIDRLATELRASGDRDLPHAFYVEQVKRTLSGDINPEALVAANDDEGITRVSSMCSPSVFQCWAMPE